MVVIPIHCIFFFNKKIYKKIWGSEERPNCEG